MKILTASILAATILITDSSLQAQPTAPASFMLCMAFHGPDGKGMGAGTPTPMAPPLAGSKLANFGDGELMSSIVFTGIEKQDAKYLGIMAPLRPAMTDAQMAEALSYVRKSFGNNAPVVTADQIKAWGGYYGSAALETLSLIEFRDPGALDELRKHPELQQLLSPFPAGHRALAGVPTDRLSELKEILTGFGVQVQDGLRMEKGTK